MKGLKRLSLVAIFWTLGHFSGHAAVMGSDMSWSCLGNDSFLIKVVVYNDCNSSTLGSINVMFHCVSNQTLISNLNLSVPTPVDITPVCNNSCTRCQSSSCSFPYGVHKYLYQGIVYLSSAGSCCEIVMSVGLGTRTSAITTGAANANFYTEARFNRCLTPCDNAPVFSNNPISILCVGQDFTFNNFAQDSDEDSLGGLSDSVTYQWTAPLSAVNTPISYTGSYAYNKPIYFWGFPNDALPFPRGCHLDPQSGDIQFRPMKAEVTVMVVKVNEYRNGTKIAELRRDIQCIVITCAANNPPLITTPNNVRSKSICVGDTVNFEFSTNDPNANDTVRISWNGMLPGAVWTDSNGYLKHPKGYLYWVPVDSQVSSMPFTFTVTAKDNACPISAQFTQAYQVTVKPKPRAKIIVSDSGCGTYQFMALRITGSGPVYFWQGDSFTFQHHLGAVVFQKFQPGSYSYKMTMAASGCSNTFYDTVVVDTFVQVSLPADTAVCLNATVTLHAKVIHGSKPYSLTWGSGNSTFSGDTTDVKQLTVKRDTLIWIRAQYDTFNCPSDFILIRVHRTPKISLPDDTAFCDLNYALKPNLSDNQAAYRAFEWTKQGSSTVVDSDEWLSVGDTGRFICVAADTFGCTFSDWVHVHKNADVLASAYGQIICYGDTAVLEADSTGGGKVQYHWYQGTNYLGNNRKIKVSPRLLTTDYLLIVSENTYGVVCSDSTKVRVWVNPLPVIKINAIDKRCLNGAMLYLNSYVTIDGSYKTGGIWSSSNPGLIYGDKFNPAAAGASTPPGWMMKYEYTDPLNGCYNRDSAFVTVYDIPKPYAGADDTICTGAKIALKGLPELPPGIWNGTGVEGVYPNWKFNPDATGIVDSGTYDAIYHYKDNNNCENDDTLRFTVFKAPGAEAGNQVNLCFDAAPFTLTGVPSGGVWSGKGVSGTHFYPAIAGPGYHMLRYSNSNSRCTSVDSVDFMVIPKIPTPQIIFNSGDSSLECSLEDGNYAWFYTPDTLSAPTTISSNTIKIDPKTHCKKCYFSVVFTDTNGCVSDTSAWYYFAVNSIDNHNKLNGFKFYPNPVHSELFIENPLNESANLLITDIFGRIMIEKTIIPGKNNIPVQTYHTGIYIIFVNKLTAGRVFIE